MNSGEFVFQKIVKFMIFYESYKINKVCKAMSNWSEIKKTVKSICRLFSWPNRKKTAFSCKLFLKRSIKFVYLMNQLILKLTQNFFLYLKVWKDLNSLSRYKNTKKGYANLQSQKGKKYLISYYRDSQKTTE